MEKKLLAMIPTEGKTEAEMHESVRSVWPGIQRKISEVEPNKFEGAMEIITSKLTTFAVVAPIVWFLFGVYMLLTGRFHGDNFFKAFIALTIYFTLGTPVSAFLAFIPSTLYILLAYITIFFSRVKNEVISKVAFTLHKLLEIIFIFVVVAWTIYIGGWTIRIITGF